MISELINDIYIFNLQHINVYLCLLAKRIKLGIYDQSVEKFALADAYFFVSTTFVVVDMFKWFFYFNILTLCVIYIIQSLLQGIWNADHPNYKDDDDQPTTSVPIVDVDADHLVKYITGEVPEWDEPWWSVDHVSIFIGSWAIM